MEIVQAEKHSGTKKYRSLSWVDNPPVQKLLDVVVSIIGEEYIAIAKQNPDIFSSNGGKR